MPQSSGMPALAIGALSKEKGFEGLLWALSWPASPDHKQTFRTSNQLSRPTFEQLRAGS